MSHIAHGYLADMGLPARFVHAAGGGRPFVLNKYDSRRWRLSIAEAAAHHGAALPVHWGQDDDADFAVEDYSAPIIRYQAFLAEHENLLHPAHPWGQVALVYPRRAELEEEAGCLEPLKRLGRLLEDGHLIFDIILDEQLLERAADYAALILPEVRRLSAEEGSLLQSFVEAGGKLVLAGATGQCRLDGRPYGEGLLSAWPWQKQSGATESGRVLYIPEGPWEADLVEVKQGVKLPVYPPLESDPFGRSFLSDLEGLLEPPALRTDAPWFVRVRAWQPEHGEALVLHWVNYQQDEGTDIEVPLPVGPLQVECQVPAGYEVERLEWLYPEKKDPVVLPYEIQGARISFTIPKLIVYGLSVLHLRKEE